MGLSRLNPLTSKKWVGSAKYERSAQKPSIEIHADQASLLLSEDEQAQDKCIPDENDHRQEYPMSIW